tara:strand:- start:19350 stop:19538 length:189 start_codon:yes stop_codon:yes gene_type:complete
VNRQLTRTWGRISGAFASKKSVEIEFVRAETKRMTDDNFRRPWTAFDLVILLATRLGFLGIG